MGIVAVSRSRVQEWVQPEPLTVVGAATVELEGSPDDFRIAGFASASVVLDGPSSTRVVVVGDAEVEPFGAVEVFPRSTASASVAFDNTGSSDDAASTAAIALVDVSAFAPLVMPLEGIAGVLVVCPMPTAVATLGDAEVSFGYFGDGDFPIFPFKLPLRFTADQSNIQDAAAIVAVSGSADLDAVGGFAPAVLAFTGSTGLTFKGATPVLPFFFPVVFDDLPANVSLAAALVSFDMDNESVVALVGESAVPVEAGGTHIASAVLPWTFPVALMGAA